jgi:Na+-driven multidrug efflux pump
VFVSGTAAAANVEGFMYAGVNAYHQSAVNFVGQNAGAGQYDRVKKTLRICLGSVMVTGIAMSTGICVFGRQLLSLYIPDSPEAVTWGLFRFYNVGSLYFLFGMMDVLTGAIRGMGSSLVPMVICLLGACGLRILWILAVFPLWRTPGGLYLCYPISWIVTLVALLVAYGIVYRKHAKNLVKGPEL